MSLRELCRAHGTSAHSAVMVQARQGDWAEKREAYRARASATYIEHRADHAALREAEVRDHAIGRSDGVLPDAAETRWPRHPAPYRDSVGASPLVPTGRTLLPERPRQRLSATRIRGSGGATLSGLGW